MLNLLTDLSRNNYKNRHVKFDCSCVDLVVYSVYRNQNNMTVLIN